MVDLRHRRHVRGEAPAVHGHVPRPLHVGRAHARDRLPVRARSRRVREVARPELARPEYHLGGPRTRPGRRRRADGQCHGARAGRPPPWHGQRRRRGLGQRRRRPRRVPLLRRHFSRRSRHQHGCRSPLHRHVRQHAGTEHRPRGRHGLRLRVRRGRKRKGRRQFGDGRQPREPDRLRDRPRRQLRDLQHGAERQRRHHEADEQSGGRRHGPVAVARRQPDRVGPRRPDLADEQRRHRAARADVER